MTLQEINHEIEQLEPAEVNTRNVQVLASLYTIRNNMTKGVVSEVYQMPSMRGTDFNRAVSGKSVNDVMNVLNEHMQVVQLLMPKEYAEVIRRIEEGV